MKAGHAPIIVVRRKKKHHGHHGGAWKVAYADFVTAMMAFFMVMWLSAQDSTVRTAIAGYFAKPGVLPQTSSDGIMSGRTGIDPSSLPVLNKEKEEKERQEQLEKERQAELEKLSSAAQHIQEKLVEIPEVASLRDQIEFQVTPEGLRIELVEKSGSSFFQRGSALLRGESVEILKIIAQELGRLPNNIVMEGHTDRAQYPRGVKYGNWELSNDRANAARRVMETGGLRLAQVRAVTGFADTALKVGEDPMDARNRRVSILVRSQAAAEATSKSD
jgi:chemotaxis protein MotB